MQKLNNYDNQESPGYSNRIYPEDDPSQKSPPGRSQGDGSVFRISQVALIDIVKETERRKFCEEVERIESLGGDINLISALGSDKLRGISNSPSDLQIREAEFGHNRKSPREPASFFGLLWDALGDFTLRVLIVCAFVSIGVEVGTASDDDRAIAWIDGFAIFLAVIVSSTVQAFNDYQKDRQFLALNRISDDRKKVTVFRDGKVMTLNNGDLLAGDIVQIAEGMDVPADGLVIEAAEILTDESALTGETEPIHKNTMQECMARRNELLAETGENLEKLGNHAVPTPILFSGSKVLQGEGKFIVIVVGPNSCEGRILSILESEEEATPLQEKLEELAGNIGKFGLWSAVLILVVLCIRFTVIRIQENDFKSENWNELVQYLLIAITVVVVAIPEGLPLSVVISLAYSVKKMLKDNNLVRTLQACETMGGANMICSDKTGTLTQNMMTFTSLWNMQKSDIDTYEKSLQLGSYIPAPVQEIFLEGILVNSSAILRPEPKGSSTEISLLKFADKCGITYESVRSQSQVLHRFPFTSSRKRMSVIVRTSDGQNRLAVKGASELILDCCSQIHLFSNEIVPLDSHYKGQCLEAIEEMAKDALRTLVVAYKILSHQENLTEKDQKGVFSVEKSGLTLICILGIKDILRKEVPDAVAQCKRAGIKVRMVTGDNKVTARAIATDCRIIEPGDENSLVLEGSEFMNAIGGVICENCGTMICECVRDEKLAKKTGKKVRKDKIKNQEAFNKIYPRIDVLARSRPEDKYALVVGLKEQGHVVAVTGDGTNDAPALKKADVGFAMGICGTQVAREAAAIILLDDNFSSIVKAVLWGRNIYDSIRKFLQFQLTVNVVAVVLTLITAATLKQEPFPPIQMLWINLIMDAFASLALATEPPSENLLDRKPASRNDSMISKVKEMKPGF